jgi:hypothetical protein
VTEPGIVPVKSGWDVGLVCVDAALVVSGDS